MEKDIRTFLQEFTLDELLERRIFLSRTSPALQGVNVEPLIELMKEWGDNEFDSRGKELVLDLRRRVFQPGC